MSIVIEIPTERLKDPEVSAAMGQLLTTLAQQRGAAPVRTPDERMQAFVEALPERSRQFLEAVREHGVLGIDQAMEQLDVQAGKAMGGITGSIARWAPEYGIQVPFEAVRGKDGKRAWRWTGGGRAPAPPVPVRARRRARAARRQSASG